MKVVVIVHRNENRKPEEFTALLDAEAEHAIALFAQEKIREIYSRTDGKGAVVVLEVKDETEARQLMDGLPMAKAGLLRFEIFGTKPYRGFVKGVPAPA